MCTRVVAGSPGVGWAAARTLDASSRGDPVLEWRPAGSPRPARTRQRIAWTSRRSSLAITEYSGSTLEALNDAGLAAHALMFTCADYEPPDDRPELGTADWVTYAVDNFATVAEAVGGLAQLRVAGDPVMNLLPGVHLALCDATGDAAILEPVDGVMVCHQGPDCRVVTNAPPFAQHVSNRARYRPFGGTLGPPGDVTAAERFVRASYYLHYLPACETTRDAVAGALQVVATAAKPPGAPYPDGDVYPTRWISAMDLTGRGLYFWDRTQPSLLAAQIDLLRGLGPRRLPLSDEDLAGDISEVLAACE